MYSFSLKSFQRKKHVGLNGQFEIYKLEKHMLEYNNLYKLFSMKKLPPSSENTSNLHVFSSEMRRAPVAWWIRELTLNPLGFSPLWFEPRSGHMWESQVLLTDGQVVFLRVLRFSPTFDERSARYK